MPNEVDSGSYTPESLKLRRRLAEKLLLGGLDTSPVQHWAQGASRMAHALMGGIMVNEAEKRETAADERLRASLASLPGLGGGAGVTPPVTTPPPPAAAPPTNTSQVGGMTVNSNAAGQFQGLMDDLARSGVTVDPSQSGGFAARNIRGTNTPSMHASGNAVDINWRDNPEGSNPADAGIDDPTRQFQVLRPDVAREAAARNGLRWGGDFQGRSPDPMHFEVAPNAATPMAQRTMVAQAGLTPPPGAAASPPVAAEGPPAPTPAPPPAAAPGPRTPPPSTPEIDPTTQRTIQILMANPATRAQGLKMYNDLIARDAQPTDEMRNYQAYRREELAAGRTPKSSQEWQIERRQASRPQVTVDQRGENAFAQEAGKGTAKRFNEMVEQGFNARTMIGDISALRDLSTQIQTGVPAEITRQLGPYAEALGVPIQGLAPAQAYQAIVDRMAPRMRVPGSGATSDFEARQFLRALPQLANTPQGNEMIQNTLEAVAQSQVQASEIASRALAGEISAREAERLIRELPDPFAAWKAARGTTPTQSTQPQTPPAQAGGGARIIRRID